MASTASSSESLWASPELVRALHSTREWLERKKHAQLEWPPSLELLCGVFELSRFEGDLLLLCAAVELDPVVGELISEEQHGSSIHPTFGLALSWLPNPHWEAIAPHSPMRRWELITIAAGPTLLNSPLRIDERILHFLIGIETFDPRLTAYMRQLHLGTDLVHSHRAVAAKVKKLWRDSHQPIQLAGPDSSAKRVIAGVVGESLGWKVYLWCVESLPEPAELDRLLRLWQREVAPSRAILVLDAERVDSPREQLQVERLVERINSPLFLLVRQQWCSQLKGPLSLEVVRPEPEEQYGVWRELTSDDTNPEREQELRKITAHFDFSAESIRSTTELRRASRADLWSCCRETARAALDGLAERLTPRADWDKLILAEDRKRILRMIAARVRNRTRVYVDWELAKRGPGGLGVTALFAGPSGTGKTLAAEVIAQDLKLDLCRVDLSQVVSKYIGETEKNIARVCEAAEQSGAVLLFDEADALFGKRSEVKDSHDRHANIEVSYLLQRMEVYRGLAILTTNLADNIDQAFLRRLRFVVGFSLPEVSERQMIWEQMFPKKVPLENISFEHLGKLQVPGGNIRNIAVLGMFLAAERKTSVTMPILLEAAKVEYAKIDRTLRDAEIEGWT